MTIKLSRIRRYKLALLTTKANPPLDITLTEERLYYDGELALFVEHLTIRQGEKIALIGPSGAGKTTLLKFLFQKLCPHAAFIHQHFALVEQLNVFHNILSGKLDQISTLFALRNLISPAPVEIKPITELIAFLGFEEKLNTRVNELSGGQKQRVAIAKALHQQKPILIADEPISAIDPHQADKILDILVNQSQTLMLSLHAVDKALAFCERIIGIRAGKIYFDSPANQLSDAELKGLFQFD